MGFRFGSFDDVCRQVPLSLCAYVGRAEGTTPKCYARSMLVFGYPVLQISTLIVHVVAVIMTVIMIMNIKAKYTAVGRKEIATFFYLYMAVTITGMLVDGNLIPMGSFAYPSVAAAHVGLVSAACWCLLLNGLVGFQFAEDGTSKSVWSVRISSALVFIVGLFVAAATFNEWSGFRKSSPAALWLLYFVFHGAALVLYVVLQIVLVVNTLEDRWPLGDILFGTSFAVMAQVCLYVVSQKLCVALNRYTDGMFFGAGCNLLAVMMIYKYWDSITHEDLEFTVGRAVGGRYLWNVKGPRDKPDTERHVPLPPPPPVVGRGLRRS